MKNQKGITLISLVITIILIMILAAVATYTGLETYENIRVEAFVTKMKAVQDAVDKFCDNYTIQEINTKGQDYSSAPSDAQTVLNSVVKEGKTGTLKSWFTDSGDDGETNYRYFSTDNISTILGIKDFDTAIFFNPRTRNVIAVEGVKYDGTMYYRQYDLSGGQTLATPNPDTDFTLSISVKTFDDKAVIYVSTDKIVTELKYQKKNGASYDEPLISRNLSEITITESGTYQVIAKTTSTEGYGEVEKTSNEQTITIVNKPLLVAGMTPVTMTSANDYTVLEDTDRTEKTDAYKNWYNYGEKKWANAKLSDGSVYVWIPRYAYAIDSSKNVNIEFMKGTSSLITTSGKALGNSYKVIPAFEDGSTTGYVNGEWDAELTGIWVAKYETTAQTFNSISYPANKSAGESWKSIKPEDAFNICRKMESLNTANYFASSVPKASGELKYGAFATDTNNIDTHLMKNSEYAAVAYLTYSSYGNKTISVADSYLSNNTDNAYSTTGDRFGIFGIVGGSKEIVAAGRNIGPTVGEVEGPNLNSENKSTKYATYYSATQIEDSSILSDAMKDTDAADINSSTKTYSTTLFSRGGKINAGGIFAYDNKDTTAEADASFRPVLIVEY